jgi:hypothetical protein
VKSISRPEAARQKRLFYFFGEKSGAGKITSKTEGKNTRAPIRRAETTRPTGPGAASVARKGDKSTARQKSRETKYREEFSQKLPKLKVLPGFCLP